MALSALTEWDVRTSGVDTNGGGFKAGASGTDWSQQNAAQYSVTDAVTAGTTSIVSATAAFGNDVVGNILYIQGGTAPITAGWYEIISRTNATTIVVDRSTGLTAGTGATLKIGGALLTASAAEPIAPAGNVIHLKSGGATHYGETVTLTISGGNGTPRRWVGYDVTHNDRPASASRPTIDGAGARANCVDFAAASGNIFEYINFEDATGANVTGVNGTARFRYCKSSTATSHGFALTSSGGILLDYCETSANGGDGINASTSATTVQLYGCYLHDDTGNGIDAQLTIVGRFVAILCIVDSAGATGININCGSVMLCTVYNSATASGDGVSYTTNNSIAPASPLRSCILANNGRYPANRTTTTVCSVIANHNCYFGNGTNAYNNIAAGADDSTLDPGFVDAANGNFAIGTNLKALGSPGPFPGALSTGYLDMGAVQRQEAASGPVGQACL